MPLTLLKKTSNNFQIGNPIFSLIYTGKETYHITQLIKKLSIRIADTGKKKTAGFSRLTTSNTKTQILAQWCLPAHLPHCGLKYTGQSEHRFYITFNETLAVPSYCHNT